MFENDQICPYTGLRSFTEDESLYFKGREEDIDLATGQLQRNKFLMITGASGDGKSSLVYAGIIPNARSGFLKSTYSNWSVASLRPERSPFKNLCHAISRELGIANAITVQGELSHGFSALVDLYKNSKLYIDVHSPEWITANDQQKSRMKREASNLIVLVDQFEEFFTNPENYHLGAPSRDANLVLNVLLETARIALEEDLPIYVIFTMRSDYIGQCAAFRGLPEYLGFSQFFVPRMNRTQLQQVIEEPAKLSANRITRRLTERLIHDLTEGVDQLPILQHALNQIWVAADRGNAEMDLIHYAKVGGMSVDELPEEQVETFNQWFDALPVEIKACYHAPSLQNVLDTHTNKLYEQAAGYYTERTGQSIAASSAKMIIRTAFTCLTKIDQSRAVRNRMTLQEITKILADPAFGAKAVGRVLNIFREPGNTFIHPFISEDDPESLELLPDQVLDITHESLIRNWQYLGQWARAEHESHTISLDFEKQLDRWVSSGKSNNFLLSIGPLTYFESWYETAKPNAWWIARYLPGETATEAKLDKANEIIGNAKDFLKKSARSHAITRMFMRYGPKRVAAVAAIIALLTLTSFTIAKYLKKQNGYLLKDIHDQTLALTNNPKVNIGSKVTLIAEEMKIGQLQLDEILSSVTEPIQRINVMNGVASLLIFQGRQQPRAAIFQSLKLTDSLLQAFSLPEANPKDLSRSFKELNDYRVTLELANFYNPEPEIAAWKKANGQRAGKWVLEIVDKQPTGFTDMLNLNLALENAINNSALAPDDINKLLSKLSPFEGGLQTDWLKSNFYKDKLQIRGAIPQNYGFSHNALYQELAYLYAASGNSGKVLQCLDTLLANSQNNFQGDYATNMDNASNIAAAYFLNGKADQLDEFVKGYCEKKKISTIEFYERLLGRMAIGVEGNLNLELYDFMLQVMNLNLQFWSRKQLEFFFGKYRDVVLQGKDKNLVNFQLSLSYKNEGILSSLSSEKIPEKGMTVKEYFDKAIALYHEVDPKFLDQAIPIVVESGQDMQMMPRKVLFIYPDLRLAFQPMEPRSFFFFYLSDVYLAHILDNHLFAAYYPTLAELNLLPAWLRDYSSKSINTNVYRVNKSHYEVLKKLDMELAQRADAKNADFNFLYLYLGKDAQDAGDLEEMVRVYGKFGYDRIFNLVSSKDINGRLRDQAFRMIGYAMTGLIKTGHFDQAMKFAAMFKSPVNRSSLYAFTAGELLSVQFDRNMVQRLVDSANVEMTRLENLVNNQPNRALIVFDELMLSENGNTSKSFQLIRNVPDKFYAFMLMCRSLASKGMLYEAQQNIPAFISGTDRADFLSFIVYGYSLQKGISKEEYQGFSKSYPFSSFWFIHYIDESS